MAAPDSSPTLVDPAWLYEEDDLPPASRLDVIESEITAMLRLVPSSLAIEAEAPPRPSLGLADTSDLLGFLAESALHHATSGRLEEAAAAVAQAAPLLWEHGDPEVTARAALKVAEASLLLGQVRQAVCRYELALALYGDLGDRRMVAHAGVGLGRALAATDDPGALPLLENAATVLAELGEAEASARASALFDEACESIHAPSGIYPVALRSRTIPPPAE